MDMVLQASSFVHPGIAGIALATGLIPIVIHLINRRRYVRLRWAAMSFLLAANRRSARRIRLEQFLLLATRVLLIVLLGLALARPFIPATRLLPLSSSRVHRVMLLDNSLSMKARTPAGPTRFELAMRYAEQLLESFPATDAVSLVTLAEPAEAVIAQAAYDRRFVRERLRAVKPTQRATDTTGALASARNILKSSDTATGNRAVYLISDLPQNVWEDDRPRAPDAREGTPMAAVRAARQLVDMFEGSAVDLSMVRTAPGDSSRGLPGNENVAITRMELESRLLATGLPIRMIVEVTNYGSSSADDLVLQAHREGRILRRERLARLEPRRSMVASTTVEFSTPGTHLIEARVARRAADVLAEDDVRYLSIDVREATPVLLVDGQPGTTRLAGQAGYLALALAPTLDTTGLDATVLGPADAARTRPTLTVPKVISEPELGGEPLEQYDVVILCNVPRLSEGSWSQLETFVAHGGGLLVFVGDLVGVDNYNRFGYADGKGLLPGRLRRSVSPTPESGEHLGLVLGDESHPLVAEFVGQPESSLFSVRVNRYLPVEPDPNRAEVALRYTNGEPAVVGSTFRANLGQQTGGGHVLLFTTTSNLDWSNLPAKGDFVSLMLSAVAYLSPEHGAHRNIKVGESIREPLTPAQYSLPVRITTAEGATVEPSLVPDQERLALQYGPVEQACSITASIGMQTRTFAVNVGPADSDLASVDLARLQELIDRPVHLADVEDLSPVDGTEQATLRSTELASFVLFLSMGLLLSEMWMAMRFGSSKGEASSPARQTRSSRVGVMEPRRSG